MPDQLNLPTLPEAEETLAEPTEVQPEPKGRAKSFEMAVTGALEDFKQDWATPWTGELTDRDALDLEALRPYLTEDAIKRAIHKFAQAGGRELRGAWIYDVHTVIRRH